MQGKRTLKWVCAVSTTVMCINAWATPEQAGLQACASALATKLSGEQGNPIKVRMTDEYEASARQLGLTTTFAMDAYTPDQSKVVARVDCTVDARGKVLRLVKLKNDAPEAKLRSL